MEQHELNKREQALFAHVDKQALNQSAQTVDPATRALNIAYAQTLHNRGEFFENFSLILETHPDISPANIGRRGFKGIVAIAMAELMDDHTQPLDRNMVSALARAKQDRFSVLAERTNPTDWEHTFMTIENDDLLSERFPRYLCLPITSDVSERSKLLKAVVKLHEGEVQRPLRIVSLGSSLNHNLKRLDLEATDPLFKYNRVKAMHRFATERGNVYLEQSQDTKLFNRLIRGSRLLMREGLGVDILDFDNPMFGSWALSNSRYLGELKNSRLNKQFSALLNYRADNLGMMMGDATDLDASAIGEPADITYAGFMFYQLDTEAEVSQALANAEACTAEDGLVVIQDFCDLDENGKPVFYKDDWPDWSCSVLVKDKKHPEKGWQKYFSVKNGRTTEVVIEQAAREAPAATEYNLQTPA